MIGADSVSLVAAAGHGHTYASRARTPAPSRAEVEVRKLDAWLALSDARITIVTPVPGQAGPSAAAAAADGAADEEPAE